LIGDGFYWYFLKAMAVFYPESPLHFNNSPGEKEVFDALRSLDDSCTILHSLHWLNAEGMRLFHPSLPIQGEADFVLLHPKGALVLEVKSGEITCERQLWKQVNRKTKAEMRIADPLAQADRSAHYIRSKIQVSLPALKHVGVFHAAWFPSVSFPWYTLPPNCDPAIVLDASALDSPATAIEKVFQFWLTKFGRKSAISAQDREVILDSLAPSFRLVRTLKLEMRSRERRFLRLTSEQALVLEYLDEQQQALITGPAGSGKTIVAFELARKIAARGEEVFFLCSPRLLRKHLHNVARNRAAGQSQKHNIDFFIPQHYAMKYFERDYLEQSSRAAEEMVLKALNEGRRTIPNLVIDEGQDFSDAWIEGLRKCTKGKFFVFYDRNQAFFQSELPSWFRQAECRLVLRRICRNTREIAITAFRIVGNAEIITNGHSGPKPKLHLYSKLDEGRAILQEILAQYLGDSQTGIQPRDIAVLTMWTEHSSQFANIAWPALRSSDSHFQTICFTSVARFKGLERRIVIVTDVDFGRLSDEKYRGFLHSGCTRAVHNLHILALKPGAADLRKAIAVLEPKTTSMPSIRKLAELLAADVATSH